MCSSSCLFFGQQSPGGEVQFLATDFAETLQEHIETYISKRNSIPAFLSAVTLELFGRQTVDITCSWMLKLLSCC